MSDCVFCKMVNGEIKPEVIFENENIFVFLDIEPAGVTEGHTLVIPKKHYETILDCPEEVLKEIIEIIKKISKPLMESVEATGLNIIQNNYKSAGQAVNHIHFHLIPRLEGDGIYFQENRHKPKEHELKQAADLIREKLNTL